MGAVVTLSWTHFIVTELYYGYIDDQTQIYAHILNNTIISSPTYYSTQDATYECLVHFSVMSKKKQYYIVYLHNQIQVVDKQQHCLVCQKSHHRLYPTHCCGRPPHDLHTDLLHSLA